MTVTFSLHEAKAKLTQLVTLAEAGETVESIRHGKVVALLTGAEVERRRPGSGVGTVEYLGDFEFTEAEIEEMFYGDIER